MKFKVIKAYFGIEEGTIKESFDLSEIKHMTEHGYWEEVLDMKPTPVMPKVETKEKDIEQPEIKEKPKRGRPKKIK